MAEPAAEASVPPLRTVGPASGTPPRDPITPAAPAGEDRLVDALDFVRRRLAGDYEVDDFGFDPDLTANLVVPLLRPLYRHWFRVETSGIANVPTEGGALLVANHAGGLWALDAAMVALAVHDEHPEGRFLRLLAADLVLTT
ncbi:MAG: hypothetical protein JO147_10505, partial [Actinobacteria bacterium]|nr:hypothetical protein [Actinomycetota bacterium]